MQEYYSGKQVDNPVVNTLLHYAHATVMGVVNGDQSSSLVDLWAVDALLVCLLCCASTSDSLFF